LTVALNPGAIARRLEVAQIAHAALAGDSKGWSDAHAGLSQ
jgi:hypothetical protein